MLHILCFTCSIGSDNCTYDTGFSNPTCVDAGYYDEIRNTGQQPQKSGSDKDDNYYEVAESSFTNTVSYDCGANSKGYSELIGQCTHTCTSEVGEWYICYYVIFISFELLASSSIMPSAMNHLHDRAC